MNEQLTLITNELPRSTGPIDRNSAKKQHTNSQKFTSSSKNTLNNSQNWWKLSKEEKELGLAGVRSIRSILQKYTPNDNSSIAKAS